MNHIIHEFFAESIYFFENLYPESTYNKHIMMFPANQYIIMFFFLSPIMHKNPRMRGFRIIIKWKINMNKRNQLNYIP